MRCTMSAFNPCKVTGDYCLIGWEQLENPGVLLANPITHSKGGKPRDGGCSFGSFSLIQTLVVVFVETLLPLRKSDMVVTIISA